MRVLLLTALVSASVSGAFLPPRFNIQPGNLGGKFGPLFSSGGGIKGSLPALSPVFNDKLPQISGVLPALGGGNIDKLRCGGKKGDTCPAGSTCRLKPLQCVNDPDAIGLCVPDTLICAFKGPKVCGCDGQTYDSTCEAYKANTNVASFSACGAAPDSPVPVPISFLPPSWSTPRSFFPPPRHVSRKGCSSDNDCSSWEFCETRQCGKGSASGTCRSAPKTCGGAGSPVCGCDGFTYSSICEARRAKVSVSSRGPCSILAPEAPTPWEAPGEGWNFPADAADAWQKGPACGGMDGECQDPQASCVATNFDWEMSTACGDVKRCLVVEEVPKDQCGGTVCGCDGQTYPSRCDAWKWGTSVQADGACTPGEEPSAPSPEDIIASPGFMTAPPAAPFEMGGQCGSSQDCSDDEYCYTPTGQCDGVGQCRKASSSFECKRARHIFIGPTRSVCGCDGVTYEDRCSAAAEGGVSLQAYGACEAPGDTPADVMNDMDGRCDSDSDCEEAEFCDLGSANCGQVTDVRGFCRKVPDEDSCKAKKTGGGIFNGLQLPVCGCDGKMYKGACDAHSKRVSVSQSFNTCLDKTLAPVLGSIGGGGHGGSPRRFVPNILGGIGGHGGHGHGKHGGFGGGGFGGFGGFGRSSRGGAAQKDEQ